MPNDITDAAARSAKARKTLDRMPRRRPVGAIVVGDRADRCARAPFLSSLAYPGPRIGIHGGARTPVA